MSSKYENVMDEYNNMVKAERIVLFGCGGHARSVINVITKINKTIEVLLVDESAQENEIILGCMTKPCYQLDIQDKYLIAVGDNQKRKTIYETILLGKRGNNISIVSSDASIGVGTSIGKGTFVAPNAYIGPKVHVGNNVIINTASIVEHEAIIGNHTHIAPHATICGRSKIGNEVFCGAGSVIIDNIAICDKVIVGAGAVVHKDITEPGIYVGVPARKIK